MIPKYSGFIPYEKLPLITQKENHLSGDNIYAQKLQPFLESIKIDVKPTEYLQEYDWKTQKKIKDYLDLVQENHHNQ